MMNRALLSLGVPPDFGYRGYSSILINGKRATYDQHDIRKATLWGTLMAGGAGVEYLFGYQAAENDMNLEDFRSRDQTWDYCRIAIDLFSQADVPVEQMRNADELVGNPGHDNSRLLLCSNRRTLPGLFARWRDSKSRSE